MHVEDLIRREGVRGQQGQPVKPSFSWKNGSVKSWYTTVSQLFHCATCFDVQSSAQCYINKEASGRLLALSPRPIFANFTERMTERSAKIGPCRAWFPLQGYWCACIGNYTESVYSESVTLYSSRILSSFRVFVCILTLLQWKFSLCARFSA